MADSTTLTILTLRASRLKKRGSKRMESGNGRFVATPTPGHPSLWNMTERRGGRVYTRRCGTVAELQQEIRSSVLFEEKCLRGGDRPHRMPA